MGHEIRNPVSSDQWAGGNADLRIPSLLRKLAVLLLTNLLNAAMGFQQLFHIGKNFTSGIGKGTVFGIADE